MNLRQLAQRIGLFARTVMHHVETGLLPAGQRVGSGHGHEFYWTEDQADLIQTRLNAMSELARNTPLRYTPRTRLFECPMCGKYHHSKASPVHQHMRTCKGTVQQVLERYPEKPKKKAELRSPVRTVERTSSVGPVPATAVSALSIPEITNLVRGFILGDVLQETVVSAMNSMRNRYIVLMAERETLLGGRD